MMLILIEMDDFSQISFLILKRTVLTSCESFVDAFGHFLTKTYLQQILMCTTEFYHRDASFKYPYDYIWSE